jgi:uncharacterized protein
MYITRSIDLELLKWKAEKIRKPLMVRGARQTGKSSTIKNFGKHFTHFIELNFDEDERFVDLFDSKSSIIDICRQIEVLVNIPIIPDETLLFFDEIQACPSAIAALRYFYERIPKLHIIAAGSLLEFALAEIPTFGVGRIRSIFMFPFSFEEFLLATKEGKLLKVMENASVEQPLPVLIHEKLVSYFKTFLIVGGMPEAVSVYVQTQSLLKVQQVLDDLIISIQTDFSKYKLRVPSQHILQVFKSAVAQTSDKFMYSHNGIQLNNKQAKEALNLLSLAGLVYNVYHSSCNGIPLGAAINEKKRKVLIFDTGIYQRLLGLDLTEILLSDDIGFVNKGKIAELHVGLELVKNNFMYQLPELFYWHRESRNSNAELDYVIQQQRHIVPIEVKANTKGSMQSMHLFIEEKKVKKGIRTSLENYGSMNGIDIFPLYAVKYFKV